MPQAVLHILFTIIVLDIWRDYFVEKRQRVPLSWIFYGGVAGLLPDIDILIMWLSKLFFGITISIHRTFTHTVFFPLIFAIIALVLMIDKSKYHRLFWIITFGVGFHILLDILFVGQSAIFYPVSTILVGLDLFGKANLHAFIEGVEAIILILWLWHEEARHKISDFI